MNLAEWRAARQRTKKVELPSGLEVEIRPVSFGAFVRGQIPDHLTPVVAAMFDGKGVAFTQSLEDMRRYFEVTDMIAMHAIVSPTVVPAGMAGENEIGVDELSEEDKAALMPLLGMTARALESFRIEPSRDVDAVLPGEDDEPATE